MPKKTITIIVPASSLADLVLMELARPALYQDGAFSFFTSDVSPVEDDRRTACCLAWLRSRGMLTSVRAEEDEEGEPFEDHERVPLWTWPWSTTWSIETDGRVQWTAEVDA